VAILWHRPNKNEARRIPRKLAELLTSPRYPKVGFAIDDDLWKLAASTDLLGHGWPRAVLDVQAMFKTLRIATDSKDAISMVDAVNTLNPGAPKFEKIEHNGNWNRDPMDLTQLQYAAGDVLIVFELLEALRNKMDHIPQKSGVTDLVLAKEVEQWLHTMLQGENVNWKTSTRLRNFIMHSCPAIAKLEGSISAKIETTERVLQLIVNRSHK
jgi:ribonuclease D